MWSGAGLPEGVASGVWRNGAVRTPITQPVAGRSDQVWIRPSRVRAAEGGRHDVSRETDRCPGVGEELPHGKTVGGRLDFRRVASCVCLRVRGPEVRGCVWCLAQ